MSITSYRKRPPAAWHNSRVEIGPAGKLLPAKPVAPVVKEVDRPIELPAYVKEGTKVAVGFRRVLAFVRAKHKSNDNEDDIRVAAAKFVQEYPGSVKKVDKDTWNGMQIALTAYRSQDPVFWK